MQNEAVKQNKKFVVGKTFILKMTEFFAIFALFCGL
jgi:hypothetical protein